jgi:hypothetical protein
MIVMTIRIITYAADAADAALPITYEIFFLFFNLKVQEEIKLIIKTDIYTGVIK